MTGKSWFFAGRTCLWCKPALAGGMLILGEKKDGKAVSDVIYLKKNDKQIKIVK